MLVSGRRMVGRVGTLLEGSSFKQLGKNMRHAREDAFNNAEIDPVSRSKNCISTGIVKWFCRMLHSKWSC